MKSNKNIIKENTEKIKLSDKNFNDLMNQKKIELNTFNNNLQSKINYLKSHLNPNFLSNETLKSIIVAYESIDFTIIMVLFFLSMTIPLAIPSVINIFSNYKILVFVYAGLIFFIMFKIISIRENYKEQFAEENYRKCQLFKSDFVSIKYSLNFTNRRKIINYYVIFLDEHNKKRKQNISKELYKKYKNSPPSQLYIVKCPKYKKGIFYHSFNIDDLENISFLKEKSKYQII